MGNVSKYINNQFFIIDSENLDNVNSKLYGYSIYNNKVVYDENLNEDMQLNGDGSYVRILRKKNTIQITQDYNGSYGLYLYSLDNKFVISNSFLKLIEYLKDKYVISINEDVALSFIPAELCAIEYKQTMINEINTIPNNIILNINILTKFISYEKIDYGENSIFIDSLEGIKILDDWFYKWVDIFRNLKEITDNIQVDLTGGFDSRIIFALLLNSNINLNKISIYSINSQIHKEDYEISSIIADKFNFKLNKSLKKELIRIDSLSDSIDLMFNVKLCCHKQFHYPKYIAADPIYLFGGLGGESLREYWNRTPVQHIEMCANDAEKLAKEFRNPIINVLKQSFEQLQIDFNIEDKSSTRLTELLYQNVRSKNHFGKNTVLYYLTNQIRFSPLLDSNLYKLKKEESDKNLLFALIFTRYCPQLLDIKFDQNKQFSDETIFHANRINQKFPFKLKKFSYIDDVVKHEKLNHLNIEDAQSDDYFPDDLIRNVFFSNSFKKLFEMYFSSDLYGKVVDYIENKDFQPLYYVNGFVAFFKVLTIVNYNNEKFYSNNVSWLNKFLKVKSFKDNQIDDVILNEMVKYDIARVDIKNNGINNNVNFLYVSDEFARVMNPDWFDDNNGRGYVIESNANKLHIKIKCIGAGELRVALRSKDIRDKNRNHFPIYIDYTSFKVNDEDMLYSNLLVHCNNPYILRKNVKNDEIIDLKFTWSPFNSDSKYGE